VRHVQLGGPLRLRDPHAIKLAYVSRNCGSTCPGGVTLIEALVSLVVMSLGILALMGLQTNLRYNADVARQRAEASRIASQELEKAREFLSIEGNNNSWDSLTTRTVTDYRLPGDHQNTTYTLVRTVSAAADGSDRKLINVKVSWLDRTAAAATETEESTPNQRVELQALVAGVDPLLGGQLAVRQVSPPSSQRNARHAAIPVTAKDLGDGRSAFKPFNQGTNVWVFNNSNATVSALCSNVTVDQSAIESTVLSNCQSISGRLVSGSVHFTNAETPSTSHAAAPAGPGFRLLSATQPLTVDSTTAINFATNHQQPICVSDTLVTHQEATELAITQNTSYKPVKYFCLVVLADGSAGWGGRFELAPGRYTGDTVDDWSTSGSGNNVYKVCRYAASNPDYVANVDHPQTYCRTSYVANSTSCTSKVTQSLTEQNYLLVKSTATCPADTRSIDVSTGVLATYNTRQHQPAPE
jgi:Tfp pilus assembly protein PilV